MKRLNHLLSRPWAAYSFAACSAVVLFLFLSNLNVIGGEVKAVLHMLSPVFIGVVIAYLVNPLADFFENRLFGKIKKPSTRHVAGVLCSIICFLSIVTLLLVALIPSLIKSISNFINNWDHYKTLAGSLMNKAVAFAQKHHVKVNLSDHEEIIQNATNSLLNSLWKNSNEILKTLGTIGASVSNWIIGIIFGFCFLFSEKTIVKGIKKIRAAIWKEDTLDRHDKLLTHCNSVFIRYVGCTLLDAAIIGTSALIFLLIMKMPYAPLIASIVAITNILPTFGPMIGTGIGMFFLVLDEHPLNALIFLIFMCVLQGVDGMVLKPILFKDSLGIPAAWTLVLIIVGGKIAGIPGILLSIPFGAIFTIVYRDTIQPLLENRRRRLNDIPEPDEPPESEESEPTSE